MKRRRSGNPSPNNLQTTTRPAVSVFWPSSDYRPLRDSLTRAAASRWATTPQMVWQLAWERLDRSKRDFDPSNRASEWFRRWPLPPISEESTCTLPGQVCCYGLSLGTDHRTVQPRTRHSRPPRPPCARATLLWSGSWDYRPAEPPPRSSICHAPRNCGHWATGHATTSRPRHRTPA